MGGSQDGAWIIDDPRLLDRLEFRLGAKIAAPSASSRHLLLDISLRHPRSFRPAEFNRSSIPHEPVESSDLSIPDPRFLRELRRRSRTESAGGWSRERAYGKAAPIASEAGEAAKPRKERAARSAAIRSEHR